MWANDDEAFVYLWCGKDYVDTYLHYMYSPQLQYTLYTYSLLEWVDIRHYTN